MVITTGCHGCKHLSCSYFVGVPGTHAAVGASPHLLSTSPCSSPFQVCPLSPPDYTCSRPAHPLHRYSNAPEPFPPPRGPSAYEAEGFCSLPLPASQLGYLSNPTSQGYAGLRLHTPPYSLYGYTFPSSPRLAASPDKMAATANHQSAFLGSSPSGTLTDSLGVLGGGQQGFLFDSRTLGLAGSQSGGGASQVTAHMGWLWLWVVTNTQWHPGLGVCCFCSRTLSELTIKHHAEDRKKWQSRLFLPLWIYELVKALPEGNNFYFCFHARFLWHVCGPAVVTKEATVVVKESRRMNTLTEFGLGSDRCGPENQSKHFILCPETVTMILIQCCLCLYHCLQWVGLLNTIKVFLITCTIVPSITMH